MSKDEKTRTIEVKEETLSRLDELKKAEESFDDVVAKLLDHYDENVEEEVDRDWIR